MIFHLGKYDLIFVLGAGASVDYGLPMWKSLSELIAKKATNDKTDQYKYKKEILDWISKIGSDKKYKTIDECIKSESVSSEYHSNGHEIENEIFQIIQDIFEELYLDNEAGWIRHLNENIKNNESLKLEERIAFISFNYDDVLDKNFLDYEYLATKHKMFNFKERLDALSRVEVSCLHPHGYFSSEYDAPHLLKESDTIKNDTDKFINAVSCYESKKHTILTNNLAQKINLFILGLGSGLEINLNNIDIRNTISEVFVTVHDEGEKSRVIAYLSDRFSISPEKINVYKDCCDLVDKCFTNNT